MSPLLEQQSTKVTSATGGTVTLTLFRSLVTPRTLSITGHPTRLFITAVTGESATLNFEPDKYPQELRRPPPASG